MPGPTPRCVVCKKTVGFADNVVRNGKLYHRACFCCAQCGKQLGRNEGVKDGGKFFCEKCHGERFGPDGFRKGVQKNIQMKKVAMFDRPTSFAYVPANDQQQQAQAYKPMNRRRSSNTKKSRRGRSKAGRKPISRHGKRRGKVSKKRTARKGTSRNGGGSRVSGQPRERPLPPVKPRAPNQKQAQEFNVAVFNGSDIHSMKEFLIEGGAKVSKWPEQKFRELFESIRAGKCELGLNPNGEALRVATVAKVFIYDQPNDLLLYNPMNTFENNNYADTRRDEQERELAFLQVAIEDEQKGEALEIEEDPASFETKFQMPSNFVFQSSFSPFTETARDAAARLVSWRFGLDGVTAKSFAKIVPVGTKPYKSEHYPGLKCEYQVHQCLLKPELIEPLQKAIEESEITPIVLPEKTNTGINTHWYVWLERKTSPKLMLQHISQKMKANEKTRKFTGEITAEIANRMFKEGDLLEFF